MGALLSRDRAGGFETQMLDCTHQYISRSSVQAARNTRSVCIAVFLCDFACPGDDGRYRTRHGQRGREVRTRVREPVRGLDRVSNTAWSNTQGTGGNHLELDD